jgi:ribose/xylose/arabinose/galactoside ABC-type transport system permease subunit
MIRRLLSALARTWLPIAVGAIVATAAVTIALADFFVVLESQRVSYSDVDVATAMLALIMFGFVTGAVYGYLTRRDRD